MREMITSTEAFGWRTISVNLHGARSKRKPLSEPTLVFSKTQQVELAEGKLIDTRPFYSSKRHWGFVLEANLPADP